MAETRSSLEAFSILDWLGLVCTGTAALGLFVFPVYAGSFLEMYAEFGDVALPTLTWAVTRAWVPPALAIAPLALLVYGLRAEAAIVRRRLSIVGAFMLSWALVGICLWGVYLPIFELAGAVTAE